MGHDRRSFTELHLEVLRVIVESEKPIGPMRVFYSANTTWQVSQQILGVLERHELVRTYSVGTRRVYKATELGVETLNMWESLKSRLGIQHRIYKPSSIPA